MQSKTSLVRVRTALIRSCHLNNRHVRIIPLASAPGHRQAWTRSIFLIYLWAVAEKLLVTNPWQISSRIRASTLRYFGASIGNNVILRPGLRVTFPWNLKIGDDSWVGEGVWFHNQDEIHVGSNAVISQESFLTTGSHSYKRDMALVTRPILIEDGVWITSRCIVLGGAKIGRSAMVAPGSVVAGLVADNVIVQGNPAVPIRERLATTDYSETGD